MRLSRVMASVLGIGLTIFLFSYAYKPRGHQENPTYLLDQRVRAETTDEIKIERPATTETLKLQSTQHSAIDGENVSLPPESVDPIPRDVRDWYAQIGFVDGSALDKYSNLSLYELEQMAKAGDVMAKSVLGLELAKTGEFERSETMLVDAVADGSMGAAILLRDLNSGRYSAYGLELDKAKVYTWQRILESMGYSPMMGVVKFSSAQEETLANLQFYDTLRMIQALHQERYGTSLPYTPQPSNDSG